MQHAVATFGLGRLVLLLLFVVLSLGSYFWLDSRTIYGFLLQVQHDPFGYLSAFLVMYTLSVVVLFPCMILQVISGALYGFWGGMAVSWTSTSLGQSLAFLLGRYLFRPTVKSYLHARWPTFPTIDAAIKKEGWKLVCLLRLSPVLPYNVLNYALAITPVNFWVFSAASAVATIPWTALYVYLGTSSTDLMELTQGRIPGSQDMRLTKQILSWAFIIGTTVYGYRVSQRAIMGVLRDAQSSVSESGALLATSTGSGGSAALGAAASNCGGGGGIALSSLRTAGSAGTDWGCGGSGGVVVVGADGRCSPTAAMSMKGSAALVDREHKAQRLKTMSSTSADLESGVGVAVRVA